MVEGCPSHSLVDVVQSMLCLWGDSTCSRAMKCFINNYVSCLLSIWASIDFEWRRMEKVCLGFSIFLSSRVTSKGRCLNKHFQMEWTEGKKSKATLKALSKSKKLFSTTFCTFSSSPFTMFGVMECWRATLEQHKTFVHHSNDF